MCKIGHREAISSQMCHFCAQNFIAVSYYRWECFFMYTRIHCLHIPLQDHSNIFQNAMRRIILQLLCHLLKAPVCTIVVIVIILHLNNSIKKIYQSLNFLVTETEYLLSLYPEASSVIPVTKCSCSCILHLWYPVLEWCWTQLQIRQVWQGIR